MNTLRKLLFACCLSLLVLSAALPALAETTIQVYLYGLTSDSEEQLHTEELEGSFHVLQNGQEIGILQSGKEHSLALPTAERVQLVPVEGSISAEFLVDTDGHEVFISEGKVNTARVMLYANKGLLQIRTDGVAQYTLFMADAARDPEGQYTRTFETERDGTYVVPDALLSGEYILRQLTPFPGKSLRDDVLFYLPPYRGDPEEILKLDVRAESIRRYGTPEPSPSPTPTPTPTPSPTPVPTPTPSISSVTVEVEGAQVEIGYALIHEESGETLAEGVWKTGKTEKIRQLKPGSYLLNLNVPEGYVINNMNGQTLTLVGQAKCKLPIGGGDGNRYHLSVGKMGAISGRMEGVEDGVMLSFTGEKQSTMTLVSGGAFRTGALLPGTYTISAVLPEDAYVGEGWVVTHENDQATATTVCILGVNNDAQVPALHRVASQTVSGMVTDEAGRGIASASVVLTDQNGTAIASVQTDAFGAFEAKKIPEGTYTLIAMRDGALIAPEMTVVVIANENPQVRVSAQQGEGSVAVCVFEDRNKNAEYGNYDKAMKGVLVELICQDGSTEYVIATSYTAEKGRATFANLPDGLYRLRVTLPDGYGFSKKSERGMRFTSNMMEQQSEVRQLGPTMLVQGGSKVECGVGAMEMSAVEGRVWMDEDENGLMDADEPGLAGVQVSADGVKNGLHYETLTGEDGEYAFAQLRPGSYRLTFTLPEGKAFTKYNKKANRSIITTEGVRVGEKTVDLNKPKTLDDQNVGVIDAGSITIVCFEDANDNGLYDEGETTLAGVKLDLYKQGSNKTLGTVTTNANGRVLYEGLRAGEYKLRAVLPEGGYRYARVAETEEGNQHTAKAGQRDSTVSGLVVTAGEKKQLAVGAVIPGSISGVVYMDDNFNGVMDEGEEAASGITVTLTDERGETVATDKTNGQGLYEFKQINPGEYRVSLTARKGYGFTQTGAGSVVVNQGDGLGVSEAFRLGMAEEKTGLNCGMIVPALVEGVVWRDDNDNGVRDAGEGGMTGVTVRLLAENGTWEETKPDEKGQFSFDAVTPGTYRLAYVLPNYCEFVQGALDAALSLDENGQAVSQPFTLAVKEEKRFGETGVVQFSPLSGLAYLDDNSNGVLDEGEVPVAGVVLTLSAEKTNRPFTTRQVTTGAQGMFDLGALRPGEYALTVKFPDGTMLGYTTGTSLPLHEACGYETIPLMVRAGDTWADQRLGLVKPAAIEGRIWMDENGDGAWNMDESAPAGETVSILDAASGEVRATLTTDETGRFVEYNLIPGTYSLRYTLPADTEASLGGDTTFVPTENGQLVMENITLQGGEIRTNIRLGLVSGTSLGGLVWADHSGKVEPLSGVTVRLLGESGQVMQMAVSGADGRYRFENLKPGRYAIDVTLPDGQLVVRQDDWRVKGGEGKCVLTACAGAYGKSDVFTLRMGRDQLDLDVGAVGLGALGDFCWLDLNGNGLQDSGEGGLPSMVVQLLQNGEVVAQTMTDQYGYYRFTDLYPAEYTLRALYPEELKPTVQRNDFAGITSVLKEDGTETVPVRVLSNGQTYDADMGFVLVNPEDYPLGYGMGETMKWTRK